MAWATFDQIYPPMAIAGFRDGPGLTREARIFERHGGRGDRFPGLSRCQTIGGDTVACAWALMAPSSGKAGPAWKPCATMTISSFATPLAHPRQPPDQKLQAAFAGRRRRRTMADVPPWRHAHRHRSGRGPAGQTIGSSPTPAWILFSFGDTALANEQRLRLGGPHLRAIPGPAPARRPRRRGADSWVQIAAS